MQINASDDNAIRIGEEMKKKWTDLASGIKMKNAKRKVSRRMTGVVTNLPSLPVCRVVYLFFTTSTRLPVFFNFYPFWEFRFQKKNQKKKLIFCFLFLPVNIGEIRKLINHFRSYRP